MPRYLNQANECTNPAAGDWLWIFDNDAALNDYDRKLNISRLAILANAQTFTAAQTFAPPAGINGIILNTPANQSTSMILVQSADAGAGLGPHINIGRNSNATTPSAGFLFVINRGGTGYSIWPDASGNLRINGAATPTSANDASGTVVGSQTSWVGIKEDITEWTEPQAALDALLACKLFHYHLKGDPSRRQYAGLVIKEEDRGAWFSENDDENQIPSLNERNLFGYLIAAIQAQNAQIEELNARVAELEKRC
jgi:hypothetical protein